MVNHPSIAGGGLQPMLVDVGVEPVAGRTGVGVPEVALAKADLVKNLRRKPGLMIS
jgi:hypothetical protein